MIELKAEVNKVIEKYTNGEKSWKK
jgi:hypothetical protein